MCSIAEWLADLGSKYVQYGRKLIELGFDDLEALSYLIEPDLKGIPIGHMHVERSSQTSQTWTTSLPPSLLDLPQQHLPRGDVVHWLMIRAHWLMIRAQWLK